MMASQTLLSTVSANFVKENHKTETLVIFSLSLSIKMLDSKSDLNISLLLYKCIRKGWLVWIYIAFAQKCKVRYKRDPIPMQGISPSLSPPVQSQKTATTPGTSCPTQIVFGFFNIPH